MKKEPLLYCVRRDRCEQALNCQKTFQVFAYLSNISTVSFRVDTRIADRLRLGPVSVSYVLLWVLRLALIL